LSLELCILASGSSGNCAVLRTPGGVMLIDAGIGPRTTAKRLAGTGVSLDQVQAICLTHLDRDHFSPTWAATILRLGIRVFCNWQRVAEAKRALAGSPGVAGLVKDGGGVAAFAKVTGFDDRAFEPLAGVAFQSIALAHDTTGSHAFVIDGFGRRVGYATDLGRVPAELLQRFEGLDLLALESNYDPAMQRASGRPWFLQQRIMGGAGHLSNEQAFDAVRLMLNRAEGRNGRLPRHIVLLHRSRQCNCPRLLRRLFERDARVAPRLVLAEQHQRTEWLRADATPPAAGEQLTLSWGEQMTR
jgi:phosphoribosyl 1,2-cyclic phosphodiesterase